jgi:hypothetical protein
VASWVYWYVGGTRHAWAVGNEWDSCDLWVGWYEPVGSPGPAARGGLATSWILSPGSLLITDPLLTDYFPLPYAIRLSTLSCENCS